MSTYKARPEHEVAYQDLVDLLRKNTEHLSGIEVLAVAANMLGKIIAMQDQRKITPEMAMDVVIHNIEHGNKSVMDLLLKAKGRA